LCLIGYYGIFFSLVGVAKKEIVPIPVAVFTPAALMFCLAIYFFRKLDWQS
jgi:hypothetical protein